MIIDNAPITKVHTTSSSESKEYAIAQGTTPTLLFKIPFKVDSIVDLRANLWNQWFNIMYTLPAVELIENFIIIRVKQEHTLKLSPGYTTKIQLKVKLDTGRVHVSKSKVITILPAKNMEVL